METEFLLGLRKGDRKHKLSMAILDIARSKAKQVGICGSAFVEIGVGLRGSLSRAAIVETLHNLYALTSKIKEVPLNRTILLNGLEIEKSLEVSNLFDCLHSATALSQDSVIVSDDCFYDVVPNLKRLSFKDFVESNKR